MIGFDEQTNVARKCTLCYDRLQGGLEPACAKACPTDSIQFGPVSELHEVASKRLDTLHSQGITQASLYGHDESVYGGLNAFFLLMDKPEAYNLPNQANAVLPRRNNLGGYLTGLVTAVLGLFAGLIALRQRRPTLPEGSDPAVSAAAPAQGPAAAQEQEPSPPAASPPAASAQEPPPAEAGEA